MLRLLLLNNIHYHHIIGHHIIRSDYILALVIDHITINQADEIQPMALVVASLVILPRYYPNI